MDKEKKIALVTCYFQHNYGSQLQALATQLICERQAWPHETIKIDGLKPEINQAKYQYFLSRIFDINTIKDKMATVRKTIAKKTNKQYATNLARRDALFTQFAETQFSLSRQYDSKAELGAAASEYSAFIVGSDQLWLPSNISADYYTLNYVPNGIGVKKIAYATSFGVSALPHKQARMAQDFLPRLDSIMLRETSGQKLVKQLIGKEVPLVCDPTLLFTAEEWGQQIDKHKSLRNATTQKVMAEIAGQKYILCYFLGNNPAQRSWVKALAQETGCKIVQLPNLDEYIKSDEGFADYPVYDIDPLDFVDLIRGAEFVATDSFHCTVFSTLNAKRFFCFRRYQGDGTVSTNSRLYSLLDTFGLPERMLTGKEKIADCLAMNIDYTQVHERIGEFRQESIELLTKALGK